MASIPWRSPSCPTVQEHADLSAPLTSKSFTSSYKERVWCKLRVSPRCARAKSCRCSTPCPDNKAHVQGELQQQGRAWLARASLSSSSKALVYTPGKPWHRGWEVARQFLHSLQPWSLLLLCQPSLGLCSWRDQPELGSSPAWENVSHQSSSC